MQEIFKKIQGHNNDRKSQLRNNQHTKNMFALFQMGGLDGFYLVFRIRILKLAADKIIAIPFRFTLQRKKPCLLTRLQQKHTRQYYENRLSIKWSILKRVRAIYSLDKIGLWKLYLYLPECVALPQPYASSCASYLCHATMMMKFNFIYTNRLVMLILCRTLRLVPLTIR